MKKLLSFVLLLSAALTVNAQPCTPNPIYADSSAGIWPESLPPASHSDPAGYHLVIDIKTLADSCLGDTANTCVYIKAFRLVSTIGLPTQFTVDIEYPDTIGGYGAWVNSGAEPQYNAIQGCFLISAPQNSVQTILVGWYDFEFVMDMYVKNKLPIEPYLEYTWIRALVRPSAICISEMTDQNCMTSVPESVSQGFAVAPNFPNPFTGTTTIPFNTTKEEACTFKVYNMLGMLVYQNTFTAKAGKNMYIMDAAKLQSGMYVFTLSNGKETFTRKMTIQN